MISLGITMANKPDLVALLIKSGKLPAAVRGTLNDAAFQVRKYALEELKKEFTLRNKFTERGIRVTKIPAGMKNIDSMVAYVGADIARGYLATHEDGKVKYTGGPTTEPRTGGRWDKLVSKGYYISKRGVKDVRSFRSTAKTGRGKAYAMMAMAYRRKERALLSLGKTQNAFPSGLYQFDKAGTYNNIGPRGFPRVKLMYARNRKTKSVQRKAWFKKSLGRFRQTDMGRLFSKNAARVFGVK